jgi:hypothetical protein
MGANRRPLGSGPFRAEQLRSGDPYEKLAEMLDEG